jgi:hypothetical protein
VDQCLLEEGAKAEALICVCLYFIIGFPMPAQLHALL